MRPFIFDDNLKLYIEKEMAYQNISLEDNFIEKRQACENHHYICQLIREDSVKEFVTYIHQVNVPLTSKIPASIFETNSYLIENNPSLIEYSAFFGSIQIFQYLRLNGVDLNSSLWLYAIHSKNAEIIHILEENDVTNEPNQDCLIESIKCHHNKIANYLTKNFTYFGINYNLDVFKYALKYRNFLFFNICLDNIEDIFYFLCKYNYIKIIEILLKNYKIDLNTSASKSPLNIAAKKNNVEILNLLLKHPSITFVPYMFHDCNLITEITVPPHIKRIERYTFSGCSSLKKINLPPYISFTGEFAFSRCSSLVEIILPFGIDRIPNNLFSDCSSLQKVVFECTNLSVIGYNAFSQCVSLVEINIPKKVNKIYKNAFCNCSSLVTIEIPPLVEVIRCNTFAKCSSLKNVLMPSENLRKIEEYAFDSCVSLEKCVLNDNVSIAKKAFCGCSIKFRRKKRKKY